MSGMSFIGSYSGIDQNTIDQLMQAERIPLTKLTNKKLSVTEQKDAWKDVNTRLNSLYDKMNELKKTASFNTKTVTSTDENYVTMEAGNSAAEGRYDIHVKQLATSTSIVGKQILAPNEIDGKENSKKILNIDGSFSIKNSEGKSIEINVKKEDSLQAIATKINNSMTDPIGDEGKDGYVAPEKIGIRASVVDNRLVLADEKSGNRDIDLVDGADKTTLSKLGLDVSTEIDGEGAGIKPGSQAEFTLNGISIKSDTNRVTGAIDGIVINLNKAHPEDSKVVDVVTIASDTEKAAKVMQDFVDQYNSTMKFIEEKTAAGDPKVPGSKGSLAGESSLIRLQSTLRRMVTDTVGKEGDSIRDASKIGISTFDKSGTLRFDKQTFLDELNKDKDAVINFLNPKGNDGGLVDRFNREVDGFISRSNGIIKNKEEGFEKSLKDIAARIEQFEDRMERKEAYYVKTFTALDVAMMKAEDQMGWLIGQVDAMNAGKR